MDEEEIPTLWKYSDLGKLGRLYPNPVIALGHDIWWTLKLDGSCLCVWDEDEDRVISSRNHKHAAKDMLASLKRTYQWKRLNELLSDHPYLYCFGELQIKGKSPTKIEFHKRDRFVGFDMKSSEHDGYLPLDLVYQTYKDYSIPTTKVWEISRHLNLDDLFWMNSEMMALAKRRRREGVVAKSVDGTIRWKTKPDYPTRQRKKDRGVSIPCALDPLPESEAFGAVDKVFADIGWESFQDKSKAMPLVAQYIREEMHKHICGMPRRSFYMYYTSYLGDKEKAM